ncbi:MAG: histidine kinase [Firmicutes bacterium HGW-Firmicutes-1]|jgi:signal transduction histidine kinase|nr:MAG: histidine kinase [Firmicutes bacterium HGW-Firmicutes-1]
MDEYNILLKKQINKIFGSQETCEGLHPQVKEFLELINRTYIDYDNDKILLERSIDISSSEYIESIEKMNNLQAQLVSNEKMAGIGELSAGIAHEINNPLGFVQSNMEIFKKYIIKMQGLYELNQNMVNYSRSEDDCGKLCQEVLAYMKTNKMDAIFNDLEAINEETLDGLQRIEKIIKSLLGFSRRGNAEEFVDYDLNTGIKDTLVIVNNEIKYNANVIEQLETIPLISALFGEINQVLLNLIVNASHAIKSKGIFGNITIHTFADENFVYCEITDDGAGIPSNCLNRVFEPFFTTKPVGSGTGLGLSIAHDIIVNKHKGNIDVKSTIGEGTVFTLTLPIHSEQEHVDY